jgi:hypothetical protein
MANGRFYFLQVDRRKVKFLYLDFWQLPPQAISCSLYSLCKPSKLPWDKEVVRYLMERLEGRILETHIRGWEYTDICSIELFGTTKQVYNGCPKNIKKRININELVIDDGFAQRFDEASDLAVRVSWESFSNRLDDPFPVIISKPVRTLTRI